MKKTSILRKLFVMIFTFITIAGFAQINANGGFESWTNGLPDGWKGNKSNISANNIVQVTDAHTGNYACMLKTVSSNKRFTTQPMTIVANQQYTISYWVKGHGRIMSGITDGASTYNYNDLREIDSPTFIQFVDTVSLSETVTIGEFIFGIKDHTNSTGNDSLIIDDVEINFYPPVDENVVATPIINVSGTMSGTNYINSANVSISCITADASIYYTTDGSTPTASSTEYTDPFEVTSSCTVKAFAIKNGYTDSEIATEEISITTLTIIFEEDFEGTGLGQMTQYSVAGDSKVWGSGSYSGNHYAYLNGYNGGVNEDWLMTPLLTPGSAEGITLNFRSATKFDGNALQLKYSTNYSGSGNPTSATWTDITDLAEWSTGNYVWAPSGDVVIAGITPLYIAFVYTCTADQAAAWEVDDIVVTSSSAPQTQPTLAIISPANGSTYITADTLHIELAINDFEIGTDGLLKIESNLLTLAGLSNPAYLDATTWAMLQSMVFTPLPAGTYTATVSLVGLDSLPLATPVTATTTFSVVNDATLTVTPAALTFDSDNLTKVFTVSAAYINGPIVLTCDNTHFTLSDDTLTNGNSTVTVTFDGTESATGTITITGDTLSAQVSLTGVVHNTVETPVISPDGGFNYDPVQVSITCATEGASIYYTIDGTEPTESATLYSTTFTVSSNTTVKAKAFKTGYDASNVVTASYTFPVEVATIAEFKAANSATNSTVYKITGDVTFVFKSGANIYIQDNTGGLLIFDQGNTVITGTYNEGDVISGGVCGTYKLYNGLVEMLPTHDLAAASSNTDTVAPVLATIEDISTNYDQFESRLVKLENVTFTQGGTYTTSSATNMTIEQNGESMQARNVFKTLDMTIPAEQLANVTGFVLRYNTNYQIAPRDNDDIEFVTVAMDTVETPVITVNPLTNDMVSVTITCATEGASIYYTMDETTPTENSTFYPESFVMVDMEFTVKAIAVKEGMVNSEIASFHYNPVGIREHEANVTIYPNPTVDQCHIVSDNSVIRTVAIFDLNGKLVRQMSVNDSHVEMDMSRLASGNYILRIATDNGTTVKNIVRQ